MSAQDKVRSELVMDISASGGKKLVSTAAVYTRPITIVHNAKCRGFQRTRKPVNIWYNNIYFLIYIVTIINRWMIMADDNMPSVNYNQRQSNTIKALRQS